MQYNKTIYLHTLLIFFCTNLHAMEIEYHTNGKPVSEHHFETGKTNWNSGARSGKIGTSGLFVHKRELEKPLSQMKIGLSLEDDGVEYIIPSDDPLREDNSLLVHLNAFVASFDGDKEAKQRLHELALKGAPINSCYSIRRVGFIQIGSRFLLIRKNLKSNKGIPSSLALNANSANDALCTIAQGRDARNTALKTALIAGDLPDDLIALIKSFDENSPEELATIQKIRKKIRQEHKNQTTLFKLFATTEAWLRGLAS